MSNMNDSLRLTFKAQHLDKKVSCNKPSEAEYTERINAVLIVWSLYYIDAVCFDVVKSRFSLSL